MRRRIAADAVGEVHERSPAASACTVQPRDAAQLFLDRGDDVRRQSRLVAAMPPAERAARVAKQQRLAGAAAAPERVLARPARDDGRLFEDVAFVRGDTQIVARVAVEHRAKRHHAAVARADRHRAPLVRAHAGLVLSHASSSAAASTACSAAPTRNHASYSTARRGSRPSSSFFAYTTASRGASVSCGCRAKWHGAVGGSVNAWNTTPSSPRRPRRHVTSPHSATTASRMCGGIAAAAAIAGGSVSCAAAAAGLLRFLPASFVDMPGRSGARLHPRFRPAVPTHAVQSVEIFCVIPQQHGCSFLRNATAQARRRAGCAPAASGATHGTTEPAHSTKRPTPCGRRRTAAATARFLAARRRDGAPW